MFGTLNAAGRRRRRTAWAVRVAVTALLLAVATPAGTAVAATGTTATTTTATSGIDHPATSTSRQPAAAANSRGGATARHTARPDTAGPRTVRPPAGKAADKPARPTAAHVKELRAKASALAARTADDTAATDCGGPLDFGTVYSCASITDGGSDTYTLTTTSDDDLLTVQLTESDQISVTGELTAPDGSVAQCMITGWTGAASCATGAAGTYTLRVDNEFGTGGYTLAVSSLRAANCPSLGAAQTAFGAAALTGSIDAGGASACFDIAADGATSGDLVRMSGLSYELQATVYDATSTVVCDVGQYGETCTLSGTGPYRVVLRDTYAQAISYRVGVTRISHPSGCATLPPAPFGDPGDAVMSGTLPVGGVQCRTITLPDGPAMVSEEGGDSTSGSTTWTLYTAAGQQACTGRDDSTCGGLPGADTYTLVTENTDLFDAADYSLAVVPLASTDGCASSTGTSYDLPLLHATLGSPVQTDCRPFTGSAGDRIDVAAETDVYGGLLTSVVDPSGTPSCTRDSDGSQDGCVLTGTGPYRVIVHSTYDFTGTYAMRIGRLSDPAGCGALAPQAYGTVPQPSTDPCWLVDVPEAGTYDVAAGGVYNLDGTHACPDWETRCVLPAAGTYALVFRPTILDGSPSTPSFISLTETRGCVPATDTGFADGPLTGSLTGTGETDCRTLPTPSGTGMYVLDPRADGRLDPLVQILDATGAQACDAQDYTFQTCALTGQAPFRLLMTGSGGATGDYALTINRTDSAAGCTDFPQSPFGGGHGATVTLTDDQPFRCLAVGAGEHSASELFDFTDSTNTPTANTYLADASGKQVCLSSGSVSSLMYCALTPGAAYTVVLLGNPGADTYQLVHRDIGATADCSAPASTTIGGHPTRGTLTSALDTTCVRVPAGADDRMWLSTAGTGDDTVLFVTDAQGKAVCRASGHPCKVSGSAGYQAVIIADNYAGTPIAYRLDSWQLITGGAFPSQCTALTSGPAGVGPFVGTLDANHPSACATVPVRAFESLTVNGLAATPSFPGAEVHLLAADGTDMCVNYGSGTSCTIPYNYTAPTALALVALPPDTANSSFTAWAVCTSSCAVSDGAPTVTALTPGDAPAGATASVTLTGTGLQSGDTVWLTRDGAVPVAGKVTGVTGTTSLTATFGLTGVATGTWDVRVAAPTGAAARLAGGFTVDAAQPAARHAVPAV